MKLRQVFSEEFYNGNDIVVLKTQQWIPAEEHMYKTYKVNGGYWKDLDVVYYGSELDPGPLD